MKLRSWNLENSSSLAALLFLLQSPNLVWLFGTPWTAARQTSLSFTISWSLLKSCPLSWWCHPTISFSVVPFSSYPQTSPAIKVFSNELALCIRWSKYWSLSFSISPSNVYSGMIYFRTDWFDLLAVQEILKSVLQPHNLKASVLWHSVFFMVQLSHLYMAPGKTILLII